MTRDEFRDLLKITYGNRPYYFRNEPECKAIRGKTPAAMANDDSTGRGIKPFYLGRRAAYRTDDLIELAVSRFSTKTTGQQMGGI